MTSASKHLFLTANRIARLTRACILALLPYLMAGGTAFADSPQRVVDIPTRPGITVRALVLSPAEPRAAVILLAGGHGGLRLTSDGAITWGAGNFLVRTREQFAEQGLLVIVLDAPSDRQSYPYLTGNQRQSADHAADLKAAIAWVRAQSSVPVWLVGTSMGTLSAAHGAIELQGADAPDGIVLTSSILALRGARPVPSMALDRIRIPVLVVHHENDQCRACPFAEVPAMVSKLVNAPRRDVAAFSGGRTQGDPCEARAYHGYNGIEDDVVRKIAEWITTRP